MPPSSSPLKSKTFCDHKDFLKSHAPPCNMKFQTYNGSPPFTGVLSYNGQNLHTSGDARRISPVSGFRTGGIAPLKPAMPEEIFPACPLQSRHYSPPQHLKRLPPPPTDRRCTSPQPATIEPIARFRTGGIAP